MSKRFESSYRTLMIDQHFEDIPLIDFRNFSASEHARKLKQAGVDSLHLTMKCGAGYIYYNGKTGVKHPGLGDRDLAAEWIPALHQYGLEAIAYNCVYYDNLAWRTHPQWRFVGPDGQPHTCDYDGLADFPDRIHVFWLMCITGGFRQYVIDQVYEFLLKYPVDSMFFDCITMGMHYPKTVCFCTSCMDLYDRNGLDPYSQDEDMRYRVIKFRHRLWTNLIADIRDAMDRARPGTALCPHGPPFAYTPEAFRFFDWIYGEGGAHPSNAVMMRGAGVGSPQCGIPAGNDAYDAWPEDLVRNMASTVLAHGNRTFFYLTQGLLPDGTMEEEKYQFFERINAETQRKQPFVHGAVPMRAVALLYSSENNIAAGGRIAEKSPFGAIAETHGRNFTTVVDALRDISCPVQLLGDYLLQHTDVSAYPLVVVPEQRLMSNGMSDVLRHYVQNGGNLFLTGPAGLSDAENKHRTDFALADIMGVTYEGICDSYQPNSIGGYMKRSNHVVFSRLPKTTYFMPGNFIRVRLHGATQLAGIAEPMAVESKGQFFNWHPMPPAEQTTYPAMTMATHGKGTVFYFAGPLFLYDNTEHERCRWPARLLQGLVDSVGAWNSLRFVGPERLSEATFFAKGNSIIVHVINHTVRYSEGTVMPLHGTALDLGDAKPRRICQVYPQSIELEAHSGRVLLPGVEIHSIIELDL